MRLQTILLAVFAFLSFPAAAQDKIYKRSGEVIKAKVKKVTPGTVVYRRTDKPDEPDRSISKAEVLKIEYETGTVDHFATTKAIPLHKKNKERLAYNKVRESGFGLNILSAQATIAESGSGLGFAYERLLDRKGMFSFYLPLAIIHKDGTEALDPDEWGYSQFITQISPGIKFYPTGNSGKVRYATGLLFNYQRGAEQKEVSYPPDPNGFHYWGWKYLDILRMGPMLHNSFNYSPVPGFYMGADAGIGFTVVNKQEYLPTNTMQEHGSRIFAQFSVRMGYRF
jgi:hypothetical protein